MRRILRNRSRATKPCRRSNASSSGAAVPPLNEAFANLSVKGPGHAPANAPANAPTTNAPANAQASASGSAKGPGESADMAPAAAPPAAAAQKPLRLPAAVPLPAPWNVTVNRPICAWDRPLNPNLAAAWAEPCGASIDLGLKLKDVLRHQAQAEGLDITSEGWMKLKEALKYVNKFESKYTDRDVRHEVAVNGKQRFQLRESREGPFVRAVRGHTMKGVSTGLDTARSNKSTGSQKTTKSDEEKEKVREMAGAQTLTETRTWVPSTPRPFDVEDQKMKPVNRADFRGGYIDYFRVLQEADEERHPHGTRARRAARARTAFA